MTTDKLSAAIDAYAKVFVRYSVETYKPGSSTVLEMESFNWGQTCGTVARQADSGGP